VLVSEGMGRYMSAAFLLVLLSAGGFAQTSILVNPDFEQGRPGARPLGWLFGFGPNKLSYSALTVTDSCNSGKQCAVTKSNELIPAGSHSLLYQYVDAKPYRNMKFRFRAAVRAKVSGSPDGAGLLVRIHRVGGESCFFNNMSDRRITSEDWAFYEITGDVCADAANLEIGMQLWGTGNAWLDDASLVFVGSGAALLPKMTTALPNK
jgi:hypothetical protein